ncbi:MAG: hypothetical protein WC519_01200 [Parcubacteria group bacterium]
MYFPVDGQLIALVVIFLALVAILLAPYIRLAWNCLKKFYARMLRPKEEAGKKIPLLLENIKREVGKTFSRTIITTSYHYLYGKKDKIGEIKISVEVLRDQCLGHDIFISLRKNYRLFFSDEGEKAGNYKLFRTKDREAIVQEIVRRIKQL